MNTRFYNHNGNAVDWYAWYIVHLLLYSTVDVVRMHAYLLYMSKETLAYAWMKELNHREKQRLFDLYRELYKSDPFILPYDHYICDNQLTVMNHEWYVEERVDNLYVNGERLHLSFREILEIKQHQFD